MHADNIFRKIKCTQYVKFFNKERTVQQINHMLVSTKIKEHSENKYADKGNSTYCDHDYTSTNIRFKAPKNNRKKIMMSWINFIDNKAKEYFNAKLNILV